MYWKQGSTSEPDPIVCQLEEVDQAVDALLEVCLCQAPCALVHEPLVQAIANNVDLDVGRSIWDRTGSDSFLVAEAPRSRDAGLLDNSLGSSKYCFKRTRGSTEVPEAVPNSTFSVSLPPVSHPRYATDESTGECKTK